MLRRRHCYHLLISHFVPHDFPDLSPYLCSRQRLRRSKFLHPWLQCLQQHLCGPSPIAQMEHTQDLQSQRRCHWPVLANVHARGYAHSYVVPMRQSKYEASINPGVDVTSQAAECFLQFNTQPRPSSPSSAVKLATYRTTCSIFAISAPPASWTFNNHCQIAPEAPCERPPRRLRTLTTTQA